MKITHKIMLGFFLVGFFIVLSGVIAVISTNIINNKVELVTQVTSPTVEMVDDLTITIIMNTKIIQEYSLDYNVDNLYLLRRDFDKFNDQFDELERSIRKIMEDEDLVKELNAASKKYDSFKDKAEKVISIHKAELAENNPEEQARYREVKAALLKQLNDESDDSISILQEISVKVSDLNKNADRESLSALKNTRIVISIITLVGIFFAVAIGFFFSKLIIRPVNELSEAAKKISEGNFDVRVKETKSHDEIHHLTSTFNRMVLSLKNVLEESPRLKKFMQITPSSEKTSTKEEKYSLITGRSYIIKESNSQKAFDIFTDKVTHNYQGLCISRANPDLIRKQYGFQKTRILWLSDSKETNLFSSSDLLIIGKLIIDFLRKAERAVILLDRLDYLIAKHGFDEVLKFIIKINDKIMISNAILLIPMDHSLMKARDLSFLEKEMNYLPEALDKIEMPPDLKGILEFINDSKRMGHQVTFKDIGNKFSITAPTTKKKISDLYHRGLIKIVRQGRNKLIDLTDKASEFISKKF